VLWYVQEQGIGWLSIGSDGGRAIQEAMSQVQVEENHQQDSALWLLTSTGVWIEPSKQNRIVCSSSTDKPTRLHKGDEDEEGVPFSDALSVKNCTPCERWSFPCLMACSPVTTVKARSSPCWICWMRWCPLPLQQCGDNVRCVRRRFV